MKKKILMICLLSILILILLSLSAFFIKDMRAIQKEKNSVAVLADKETESLNEKEKTYSDVKLPDTKEQKIDSPRPLKFIAVGDILLGRDVKKRALTKKERYLYPFLKVADILKTGDIVFGNLEESITSSSKSLIGIKEGGKYVLKNDVEAIEGIKFAGFNLLSLANNHILDYYETGLFDTEKILSANNITYAGVGKNLMEARKLSIIEKGGLKIGLLAYTDMTNIVYKGNPPLSFLAGPNNSGVAPTNESYIKEDIKKAKASVDFLIVSFHWGVENSFFATKKQEDFAHYLIDNGVDMILGHHSHRTQGVEIYKGKPIFYSLGNFIFDQNIPENMQGFIMNMEFTEKKLSLFSAIPYKILNKCQIVPQSGIEAEKMINREINLCKDLNTKSEKIGDELVFDLK